MDLKLIDLGKQFRSDEERQLRIIQLLEEIKEVIGSKEKPRGRSLSDCTCPNCGQISASPKCYNCGFTKTVIYNGR